MTVDTMEYQLVIAVLKGRDVVVVGDGPATAAALAVRGGVTPQHVPVEDLRKQLTVQGAGVGEAA
jgi:hypothetical protein